MVQIETELAQNADTVDPGAYAQVLHILHPTFHNLRRNRFSWLQFTHQKAIKVGEYFSIAHPCRPRQAHLQKGLEPRATRTSENACCHNSPPFWPGHDHLPKCFEIGFGIDERGIQTAMAQHIGDGLHR